MRGGSCQIIGLGLHSAEMLSRKKMKGKRSRLWVRFTVFLYVSTYVDDGSYDRTASIDFSVF